MEDVASGNGAPPWSAQRVTAILDIVHDGVLVIDRDGLIRYVNPVAAERLGGVPADVVGLRLDDLLVGLERTSFPTQLEHLRRHGGQVVLEEFVPELNGWFHLVATAEDDGEITIFVREVTGQLRVERQARLVSRIDEAAAGTTMLRSAIEAVARVLREELGFDLVETWVRGAGDDEFRLVAADREAERPELTDVIAAIPSQIVGDLAPVGRAFATADVVTVTDLRTEPHFVGGAQAEAAGIRTGVWGCVEIDRGETLVVGLLRASPLDVDDAVAVFDLARQHVSSQLSRRRAQLEVEQLFELTREYVAIVGFDGRYRRVNPAMVTGLGYGSSDDVIAMGPLEIVHPDDRGSTARVFGNAVLTGQVVERFENRIRHALGGYRWVSWSARVFGDEELLFATGRDVTDERDERLLREGQAEVLRGIVDGIAVGETLRQLTRLVELRDPTLRCSAVLGDPAPAHDDGSGRASGAAASRWSVPVLGSDRRPLGRLDLWSSREGGPTEHQERLVRDAVGLAGVAIERSRSAGALVERESRLRLITEVVTDAIFDWEIDGGRWRTTAFRELLGHHIGDEVTDAWWAEHLHPDEKDDVLGSRLRAIRSGADGWESEHRLRRPDGSDVRVAVRARIVRGDHGEPLRMIGGMSDVTERRELERSYLRAQRVESLGTLAGGIAHDLNNSLMPILMASELLAAEDLPDDVQDTVDVISLSARRSAEMVRSILTYARGADGSPSLVEVDDVVRSTVRMARDTFPKDVGLVVTSGAPDLCIRGDATQLHQVVMNLALNARDAMPDGGTLSISLAEVELPSDHEPGSESVVELPHGRYVRIRVADTGSGITQAVRDRLFEPFFTTKDRTQGTGLGLPTALAIARALGGGLTFSSEVGVGSTFDLLVPSVSGDVGRDPTPALGQERLAGDGASVLVVDDEPAVRAVVSGVLGAAGYSIVEAGGGADALAAVDHHDDLDLIVTDLLMPGLDGVELVERLRAAGNGVPVVAMTGFADDQRVAMLAEIGVTDVLPKPFDRAALLRAVADARARR